MSPEAAQTAEALAEIDNGGIKQKGSHWSLEERLIPSQRASVLIWLEENEETYKSAAKRIHDEYGVPGVTEKQVRYFHQRRRVAIAKRNLAENAIAAREIVLAKSDTESVEDAVVAQLINRSMEVVNEPKITPSHYREVVGLVVRLREQNITKERLKIERARFELDVAEMVMKHIDKLKQSGALQIEDRGEAARKIRDTLFGKYTQEQLEAVALVEA